MTIKGRWGVKLLLLVVFVSGVDGQQGGSISGVVRDRSGDAVAAAEVRVQSQETGARQIAASDGTGQYTTPELTPGSYKVTVRRDGFRTISQEDVAVTAGKITHVDLTIDILPLQQEVSVVAAQSDIDPTASGLTMTREAPAASLPQNGRDVHTLFAIMPGATVTPASISAGGQFTVSGQRPNANSFRVDGLSANVGVGIVSVPGAFLGSTLPGMSTLGGMQSLASKEETETVELRSVDFDSQYGDRPGAQINITTRSGSDDFHGSWFGYIRPHALDSMDWFARGNEYALPSASLSGWGGGMGGPIWKKRTYFFAAFEKIDLHDDALQVISVPNLAARNNPGLAPYQLLFDAFPAPAGRPLNANESIGYSPLQKAGAVTNRSIRIDQAFSRYLQGFVRFSSVPSSATSIELGSAYSAFRWDATTAGLSLALGKWTHELRFNYTEALANSQAGPNDAPAVNSIGQTLANDFGGPWGIASVSMAGVGRSISGEAVHGHEHQLDGLYTVARQFGRHDLRGGFEYDRLESNNPGNQYDLVQNSAGEFVYPTSTSLSVVSPGISQLLSGAPLGLTSSIGSYPYASGQRFSSFATDTIRINDRFNILVGARWDVVPVTSYGLQNPATFTAGYWNGLSSAPVSIATSGFYSYQPTTWSTSFLDVAPRAGFAYHLKSPDLILRAGAGLFYDTGLSSIISNTDPLTIWQYLPNPAALTLPNTFSILPTSALTVPRVWEWKASLEKILWENSLLSLSYFGANGSKLLRSEASIDPPSGFLQTISFASHGTSNYQAVLGNFRANLTPNIFALASYTWSHSIDTGSSDTVPILIDGPSNKGSSGFDVRQVLTAAIGYRTPSSFGHILGGWSLSSNALARGGFPFDVSTVDRSIGLGFDNADRASLVPGQPIWLNAPGLPGGKTLNPAAFQIPANGVQGSLGRNSLVGPGFFQIDASLRRQMRLYRGTSVEASVSAFNLLNHPSFADPVNYLGSALFGQSTSMTSLMLGSGSPTTGLAPLFQAGGPRTIELSLRFSF